MINSFIKNAIITVSGIALLIASCSGDGVSSKPDPGEALYKKFQCISCHGSKGTRPYNLTDSDLEYTYSSLKEYIDNPGEFGNEKMPAFKGEISEKEYQDLIAYIIILKNNVVETK